MADRTLEGSQFTHSPPSNPSSDAPSTRSRVKSKLKGFHLPGRRDSKTGLPSSPIENSPNWAQPNMPRASDNYPRYSLHDPQVATRSAAPPVMSAHMDNDFFTRPTTSTRLSLQIDPRYSTGLDDRFLPPVKLLSPIAEQEYISPELTTSQLPGEDVISSRASTPTESQYSGILPFSSFINRPLNRSISQGSSRTHASTSSIVAAPIIPPLDFRPTFGQINIPMVRAPKPVYLRGMSPIPGSSEGHHYDDESFKTAESIELSQPGRTPGPSGGSRAELFPRSPQVSQSSSFTSFFNRRWRRSEGYGSGLAIAKFPKIPKPSFCFSLTPACWLFWAGFVAPWCWVIGGWYYTVRGEQRPKYGKGLRKKELILPRWVTEKGVHLTEKEAVSYGVWFGYPYVAPAAERVISPLPSRSPPTLRAKSPKILDPWIFRCRIAALSITVLLLIGFIAAFVVVGHKY